VPVSCLFVRVLSVCACACLRLSCLPELVLHTKSSDIIPHSCESTLQSAI
jgi:hypothetical protein